jgi:hypothetical protein
MCERIEPMFGSRVKTRPMAGMSGYVVGETPNQYRIEAIERMRLAGRLRGLKPGERALVSRYAIPEVLLDAHQQ